jgi:ribosomal protein S27AE/DNA-directed RNA polymerase subunit RPC12/RpoP
MGITNKKVFINGKQLRCFICEGTHFTVSNSLLNTRMMTILNLEWTDSEANTYICEKCGHILWFKETPNQYYEDFSDDEKSEIDEIVPNYNRTIADEISDDYEKSIANENECPNCFSVINKDDIECENCGYMLKK